jgi:hypothetical protein
MTAASPRDQSARTATPRYRSASSTISTDNERDVDRGADITHLASSSLPTTEAQTT